MKRLILFQSLLLMLAFNCSITIGQDKTIKGVADLEIRSSRTSLADQCIIKLPNLKKQLENQFSVGDAVTVNVGYGTDLNTEFEGYISAIKPNKPFELICEDGMYLLKKTPINKAWRSITLKSLLNEIAQNVNISADLPDITLSPFRLENTTAAKALEKLKDEYGLTTYFRGNTLYAGLAYSENITTEHRYDLSLGLPLNGSDLKFRKDTDSKVKLKAISILPNNTQISVEVGDADGEQRTWHTYNIESQSALKTLATEKLRDFQYSGYEGFIQTLGIPYARHGEVAVVSDSNYPERIGSYVIDEVITTVSKSGGMKRKVRLGLQV